MSDLDRVTVGKIDEITQWSEIICVIWVNLNKSTHLIIPDLRLAGETETIRVYLGGVQDTETNVFGRDYKVLYRSEI